MLAAVRGWILVSALLVGSGWILSALHALNRVGYAICFGIALGIFIFWSRTSNWRFQFNSTRFWSKFKKRFSRLAPLFFLLMALLNLAGGFLDRPDNGDTNAYRIPRVLHWLWQGGWHWIHTGDSRMNIAGCNYEWLFAPLILFTRTDRWLFLVNALSFIFLPGLIFDFLRRMQIAPRVAWWWMWILASAWCFVLQADSTLNDSLGAIYALAAVAFALRAAESKKIQDLWFSLLAAGLLTGLKQTNLPLLLPWLLAIWPARKLFRKNLPITFLVGIVSLLISAVPLAYLNWKHVGTWTGFPTGQQAFAWGQQQELDSPFWGLLGNCFCVPAQNLLPPFFPWAGAWNGAMQHFLQTGFGSHFTQFERFGRLDHALATANAGIGLGIILLAVISFLCAGRLQNSGLTWTHRTKRNWHLRLLKIAPWISLVVFMAKVGTYENARQAAPYYILLFPVVFSGAGQTRLTRLRWWQWLAVAVIAFTFSYLGLVRGRSLLPENVVQQLLNKNPRGTFAAVFGNYYAARAAVDTERKFLQNTEAAGEKITGYANVCTGGEPGWWLPFGSRCIERVLPDDTSIELRLHGIHFVVVEDDALRETHQTIEQWTEKYRGEIIKELTFPAEPGSPPGQFYLVHLRE